MRRARAVKLPIIEQIKLLTNNTNELLINLYIDKTIIEISNYLKQDYEEKYENILVDIVVIKINRRGTEGLQSQSYSGASESFLTGYPDYIINQLDSYKKKVYMI